MDDPKQWAAEQVLRAVREERQQAPPLGHTVTEMVLQRVLLYCASIATSASLREPSNVEHSLALIWELAAGPQRFLDLDALEADLAQQLDARRGKPNG